MRNVLLTGGAGFVGSHLAEALFRNDVSLTIVDSLHDFYSPDWKRANLEELRHAGEFTFIEAYMRDSTAMRDAFQRSQPEIVVHLAPRAGVRPSIEQPRECGHQHRGHRESSGACTRIPPFQIPLRRFQFRLWRYQPRTILRRSG